jgi:hypothetical protein
LALERRFPDLRQELIASGAVLVEGGRELAWNHLGAWRVSDDRDLKMLSMSRPLLESAIAKQVRLLSNVRFCEGVRVVGFETTHSQRVTGVRVAAAERNDFEMPADLVVDASGRGSATPRWLEALGLEAPKTEHISARISYATCAFSRSRESPAWRGLVIAGAPARRGAVILPIEGDRWLVSLAGYFDEQMPASHAEFRAFALLYEADVHAENAAYVLHRSGGIEKMAREGIFKPVHVDPRDVGDGMDAYGNPIHYPDEESASAKDQEDEDESPVEVPSTDLLFDYVDSAPTPSGTVKITARYGPGVRGRVVQFLHIEPAPPAPDTAPPPAAILPVEMSRRMRERLSEKGAIWWLRVERQVTEACSEKFVATKMVKPEEAHAAKAKRARARRVYALRETGQPSTSERRVAVEGMERLPDGTFRSVVSLNHKLGPSQVPRMVPAEHRRRVR